MDGTASGSSVDKQYSGKWLLQTLCKFGWLCVNRCKTNSYVQPYTTLWPEPCRVGLTLTPTSLNSVGYT